jgi:hypothetical protein
MTLEVQIPRTPSGKVYRHCPNAECAPRLFLLGETSAEYAPDGDTVARQRHAPGTPGTTCPYCGGLDDDDAFHWEQDLEYAKQAICDDLAQDAGDMLRAIAARMNSHAHGNGMFSLRATVKTPARRRPRAVREDLLRELACGVCGREYGVYATALFCPDCAAPTVGAHFAREVELIRDETELAEQARANGKRELAYRLLGNAHEDVVTAFEATQKMLYRHLVRHRLPDRVLELLKPGAIGSAFQNIGHGRRLFAELGVDPYDEMPPEEIEALRLNIEKRHVIGHNLSLADDRYASLSSGGERGQTITLLHEDIDVFAALAANVADRLQEAL